MSTLKVFVADDDIQFVKEVCNFLELQDGMEIIGTANDGMSCLSSSSLYCADVLILDDVMPMMDGLTVLQKLKRNSMTPPIVLVIASIYSDYVIGQAMKYDANAVLAKPCNHEKMIRVLYQAAAVKKHFVKTRKQYANFLEGKIKESLLDLGVSRNLSGFDYLYQAINMFLFNRNLVGFFTKIIYPAIADRYSISVRTVERRIKYAIEAAWSLHQGAVKDSVGVDNLPSPSEFIAKVSYKITSEP